MKNNDSIWFETYLNVSASSIADNKILVTELAFSGTVTNSAPHQFFIDSNIALYGDMLETMENKRTNVPQSQTGIDQVNVNQICLKI